MEAQCDCGQCEVGVLALYRMNALVAVCTQINLSIYHAVLRIRVVLCLGVPSQTQ